MCCFVSVHCEVSNFTATTNCSVSCGGGTQEFSRVVVVKPANGGDSCPHLEEDRQCNTHECPVDCIVGDYMKDGSCSVTCGTGGQQRYVRLVLQKPSNGGEACPELEKTEPCVEIPCSKDCKVSEFQPAGECSTACGQGQRLYERFVVEKPSNGGSCPHLREYRDCQGDSCPGKLACCVYFIDQHQYSQLLYWRDASHNTLDYCIGGMYLTIH